MEMTYQLASPVLLPWHPTVYDFTAAIPHACACVCGFGERAQEHTHCMLTNRVLPGVKQLSFSLFRSLRECVHSCMQANAADGEQRRRRRRGGAIVTAVR